MLPKNSQMANGFKDEMWSLATLDNGKIPDVHARKIKIGDICFGNQK